MRLLLDTHIFLWWMDDAAQLEERLRAEIADPKNEVFLSSVVIWEITIKAGLGKLEIAKDWFEAAKKEPFSRLPITGEHAYQVGLLSDIHRDPFDRLLIAQSQVEALTLVTKDPVVRRYNISVL